VHRRQIEKKKTAAHVWSREQMTEHQQSEHAQKSEIADNRDANSAAPDARDRQTQLFLAVVAMFVLQHWNQLCSNEMLIVIFTNLPIIGPKFLPSRFESINGNWCANPDMSLGFKVWLRDELKVFIAVWVVVCLIFGSNLKKLFASVFRAFVGAIFYFNAYLTRFCLEVGSLVLLSNLFQTSRLDQFMFGALSSVAALIFLQARAMRFSCYFLFSLVCVFKTSTFGLIMCLIGAYYYFRHKLSLQLEQLPSWQQQCKNFFKKALIATSKAETLLEALKVIISVVSIFVASFLPPRVYFELVNIVFKNPVTNCWHLILNFTADASHSLACVVSGAWLSFSNLCSNLVSPILDSMSMPVYAGMATFAFFLILIVILSLVSLSLNCIYHSAIKLWQRIAKQCPQNEVEAQPNGSLNSICSGLAVVGQQLQQSERLKSNFFGVWTPNSLFAVCCVSKSTFFEFLTRVSLFLVSVNILKVLMSSFVPPPALLVTWAFDSGCTVFIIGCVFHRFVFPLNAVSAFLSSKCDSVICLMKGLPPSNKEAADQPCENGSDGSDGIMQSGGGSSQLVPRSPEDQCSLQTHSILTAMIVFLMICNSLLHASHEVSSLSGSSTPFKDLIYQSFSDSCESLKALAWSVFLRFSPLFRLFKLILSQFLLILEDDTRFTPAQILMKEFDTCYIIDFTASNHDAARLDFSPAYGNATMFFQPIKNHRSVGAFVVEINGSAVPALDLKPIKGLLEQSLSLCFTDAEQSSSDTDAKQSSSGETQMFTVSSFVFRRFHRVVLELPLHSAMVFNRSVVPWIRATQWKASLYSQAALLPGQKLQGHPSCDSHKCRPVGGYDDEDACWWWWCCCAAAAALMMAINIAILASLAAATAVTICFNSFRTDRHHTWLDIDAFTDVVR